MIKATLILTFFYSRCSQNEGRVWQMAETNQFQSGTTRTQDRLCHAQRRHTG